jgi:hypothetical protein
MIGSNEERFLKSITFSLEPGGTEELIFFTV